MDQSLVTHKLTLNGVTWEVRTKHGPWVLSDILGFLPEYLMLDDKRSAAEQFNDRYAHGGGWRPVSGWEGTGETTETGPVIKFPGDPKIAPIAKTALRDESIYLYPSSWVSIVQPNGEFAVARLD